MVLLCVFGLIGGSVLAASSRGPAFILRMLVFSVALSAATAVSRDWGAGGFCLGFLAAATAAQLGLMPVIVIRLMLAQRAAAPVLQRDVAPLR